LLDLDSTPTVILVERYALAVLYYAAGVEGQLRNELNFLSASSVCEWNNGLVDLSLRGVACNGDDLVVDLVLYGKSKHEEVIILISKFRIDSPAHFPFRSWGE
jgi:hypothetical protein